MPLIVYCTKLAKSAAKNPAAPDRRLLHRHKSSARGGPIAQFLGWAERTTCARQERLAEGGSVRRFSTGVEKGEGKGRKWSLSSAGRLRRQNCSVGEVGACLPTSAGRRSGQDLQLTCRPSGARPTCLRRSSAWRPPRVSEASSDAGERAPPSPPPPTAVER